MKNWSISKSVDSDSESFHSISFHYRSCNKSSGAGNFKLASGAGNFKLASCSGNDSIAEPLNLTESCRGGFSAGVVEGTILLFSLNSSNSSSIALPTFLFCFDGLCGVVLFLSFYPFPFCI